MKPFFKCCKYATERKDNMYYIYGLSKDNHYEIINCFQYKGDAQKEVTYLKDGFDDYYVKYKITKE